MVQYYTLQEAAAKLRVSVDGLKEMAKNGEVRAFQDRGNLRFRAQEVDELARLRGFGSDPDLQLGDAPPPARSATPSPRPASPTPRPAPQQPPKPAAPAQKPEPSVFDFTLGTDDSDEVSLGQDLTPTSSSKRSGPQKSPTKSGPPKSPGPKSPSGMRSPQPSASDSDVRLVSDGTGLDFQVDLERGSQSGQEPPSSHRSGSGRRKTKADQADSGVRIVPLDQATDSDVKMVPDPAGSGARAEAKGKPGTIPSDSDIRMESGARRPREDSMVTEEIDLDAEARKAEEAAGQSSRVGKGGPKAKPTRLTPAAQQPFELAAPDSGVGGPPARKSGVRPPAARKDPDTSSEFELMAPPEARPGSPKSSSVSKPTASGVSRPAGSSSVARGPTGSKPPGASSSVLKGPTGSKPPGASSSASKAPPKPPVSEDVPMLMGDEDVNLGEITGAGGGSGINLKDPADSGISLEKGAGGADDLEFELSLDSGVAGQSGVKEGPSSSSNEFELSVDEGSGSSSDSDSESEFELSLDVPEGSSVKVEEGAGAESDSDSEFELTLDEAGGLAAVEESEAAEGEEENKDIFETDFEVPALEEGSASEAVALEESESDSSSDFDLDLNDEATSDSESASGSQVVALDDGGEADEGAETVAKPRRKAAAVAEGEAEADEDLEGDLEEEPEEEEETEAGTVYVTAPPAEWGIAPAIGLSLSAIVLFVASLVTFELVHGLWGYQQGGAVTGPVSHSLAKMFGADVP